MRHPGTGFIFHFFHFQVFFSLVCDFSPYLSFDVSDKIASVRLIQAGRRLLLRQFLPPHELKQVNTKGFAEFLMQTLNISKRIPENFSSVLLQSSRDQSNLLSVLNNEFQNKATALKLLGSCQEGVCHPVHIADLAGVNVDVLGEVKIKVQDPSAKLDTYLGLRL